MGSSFPTPREGSTVGNVILTSERSTRTFLWLLWRSLGRGTDMRKASVEASDSISSWGAAPSAGGGEGRDAQIRLSLREEGPRAQPYRSQRARTQPRGLA